MSARIFDFEYVRHALAGSEPRPFSAIVRTSAEVAKGHLEWSARREAQKAARSAAGKLGAAAAKGKPRHCRFCRQTGHYGNNCPQAVTS